MPDPFARYDIWLQEPYMSADTCETCGGDSYPCECDERSRDDDADRRFEDERERRYQ
jgi:hypothetical protein